VTDLMLVAALASYNGFVWGSLFHLASADYCHPPMDMYKQNSGLVATHSSSACWGEKTQVDEAEWGGDISLPSSSRGWKSEAGMGTSWHMLIMTVV